MFTWTSREVLVWLDALQRWVDPPGPPGLVVLLAAFVFQMRFISL